MVGKNLIHIFNFKKFSLCQSAGKVLPLGLGGQGRAFSAVRWGVWSVYVDMK